MSSLDWWIFALYLIVTAAIGFLAGRNQKTTEDYFLGARRIPWWAAMLSLVATETSAVTVVAIPAEMYAPGGNFGFLQCALGFALGKILISIFVLPAYFQRKITTPYEFLAFRLGRSGEQAGVVLFMTALFVGAAFRVYVGAIPLSEAAGIPIRTSLIIITILAIAYTWMGGLRAVIYTDVFQMVLFVAGGVFVLGIILFHLPEGWTTWVQEMESAGKTKIFDTGIRTTSAGNRFYDWTVPYTLAAGMIGATFVTLATHGTDHSNLQRLLACRSLGSARAAIIVSALIVTLQFVLFLAVGGAVHVFYRVVDSPPDLANRSSILPYFIVNHLPTGLAGLLIAGVFAAAMSTVDSALSALSATTVRDWFRREANEKEISGKTELKRARRVVFFWGVLLWGGAEIASRLGRDNLIHAVFSVANSLYGPLLGLFLIALFLASKTPGTKERRVLPIRIPLAIGLAVQVIFFCLGQEPLMGKSTFKLAWPWVTLVGALATFCPAWILSYFPAAVGKK